MIFTKGKDQFKRLLDKLKAAQGAVVQRLADEFKHEHEHMISFFHIDTEKGAHLSLSDRLRPYKWLALKSAAAFGIMTAVVWSGHQYVMASMVDLYVVYADGEPIGTVADPAKVEQFKQQKREQMANLSEDVRVVVKEPRIELKRERAFNGQADEQAVLDQLNAYFSSYPVGIQLLVDGKPMGALKDEATAKQMLEQIKAGAIASLSKKKEAGKVGILSAAPADKAVQSELLRADFVQQVELKEVRIAPEELNTPEQLRTKLETGDVQPTKYTVVQGDCVSCIAKKLNISKQVIYQNNPETANDKIKAGQQLDLTVLKPTLAVRTVEKIVENQEIQYDTEYVQDSGMRLGETQTLTPGRNGLKTVSIELTKVNGFLEEETVLNEQVVQQPQKAVMKRGTKVVKGEGSGKFAWPVVSASISSTFGTRWGAFHKGVDLTGNRNIMAADNGKVVYTGYKDDYGNMIVIDHLNGYQTVYAHLSKIDTTTGTIVEKGDKIGIMGSTGDSTGVHLHFEVLRNQTPDNPLKYLNR